jgi:hypothetical protein
MQDVRDEVQTGQLPRNGCRVELETLADDLSDLRISWIVMQLEQPTSSAASAFFIANSIARPISALFPLIDRNIASNRFLASLPILPFSVRSFSESSAESEEYIDA